MPLVTSHTTVDFPKLKWSIRAGEQKELPDDKDAQKQILANECISEVKAGGNKNASDTSAPKN